MFVLCASWDLPTTPTALILLGCSNKTQWSQWLRNSRNISHSCGVQKSQIRFWHVMVKAIFQVADFQLYSHPLIRTRELYLKPFVRVSPSWPNHLPRLHLLIPSPWELDFNMWTWWWSGVGDTVKPEHHHTWAERRGKEEVEYSK